MDEYICGLQMIREGMRQGLLSANHFLLSFVLLCSIITPICFISDTVSFCLCFQIKRCLNLLDVPEVSLLKQAMCSTNANVRTSAMHHHLTNFWPSPLAALPLSAEQDWLLCGCADCCVFRSSFVAAWPPPSSSSASW